MKWTEMKENHPLNAKVILPHNGGMAEMFFISKGEGCDLNLIEKMKQVVHPRKPNKLNLI